MSERNLYEVTGGIKDINTLLVSREEWNRRAQPAQAGQVLITSETGNAPDQGASAITSESGKAGQVLTNADWPDVDDMAHSAVQEALAFGLNHDVFYRYGHAVLAKAQIAAEQAVLAKRVPMPTRRITYTCPACHFSLERQE